MKGFLPDGWPINSATAAYIRTTCTGNWFARKFSFCPCETKISTISFKLHFNGVVKHSYFALTIIHVKAHIFFCSAITGNWERKRPVWAMLMVNGLTKGDIASRGFPVLDLYLAQMAAKLKKKVFYISLNSHKSSYKLLLGGRCGEGGRTVPASKRPHVWPGNHVTHVLARFSFSSPLLLIFTFNLLSSLKFFMITFFQVIFALNQTLQLQKDVRQGNTTPQFTTEDLIK